MSIQVIQSGDWVTFPTGVATPTIISWDDKDAYSAKYFRITGRWGTSPSDVFTKSQEVYIFIAEEYYTEACKFSWPENIWNWALHEKSAALIRIDSRFQYGQSYRQTRRFIVYHPKTRNAYQGRFLPSMAYQAISALDTVMPDTSLKLNKTFFSSVSKLGQSVFGDALHTFDEPPVKWEPPVGAKANTTSIQQVDIEHLNGQRKAKALDGKYTGASTQPDSAETVKKLAEEKKKMEEVAGKVSDALRDVEVEGSFKKEGTILEAQVVAPNEAGKKMSAQRQA